MSVRKPNEAETHMRTTVDDLPPMVELTPEESWAFFDQEARRIAGVGLDEFIRKVRAGEYHDVPDDEEHWDLIFLVQAVGRG